MELEFDQDKDAANIAKHGVSLRLAPLVFEGSPTVETDIRFAYGEERLIATGEIEGRVYVCAYTMRGTTLRAISLRKANRREVNAYRQSHPR